MLDAFLSCLKIRCSAYKTSISYADGKMRRTANAPAIIRNCKILLCLFAELRINSFYGELICTQMRDCRLTNPQVAYKSVRYFHFTLRRDGDAFYLIRKSEILNRLFAELRIISFDDELICTQIRDCRLTNPQAAYKTARFFHFALRRDGGAFYFIRKSEILNRLFADSLINYF